MKKITIALLAAFLILSAGNFAFSNQQPTESPTENKVPKQTAKDEAFHTMMQVIAHKRCVNCHPSGDKPRQGEDSHLHQFGVQRGADNHGLPTLKCGTCHQKENNDFSGVPGAPHWHLAPKSMAWEGLNKYEIAAAMLDKSKNGNKTIQEIEKHLTEDLLVLWAFEPGINHNGIAREKPPVSKADYIKAVKAWVAEGAVIPNEK